MNETEKIKKLKELFGFNKIDKLAVHDDADGLTSGVLLTYVFKTAEVMAPDIFGEVEDSDVCTDMKPVDPNWNGLCFDHHPGHPEEGKRKYTLVWGDEPATKVVFDKFKEFIPEQHQWKMAIGTAGDGRAEIVPLEIWRNKPMLLSRFQSVYDTRGQIKLYPMPLYMRVVSGINACCKIPGKWYNAYTILRSAQDPLDIIFDPAINLARKMVSEETKRCIKDFSIIDLGDHIRVWPIESEYKVHRGLAWRGESVDHKTTVVINRKNGNLSIRGLLATLICEELNRKGYELGGHPGFAGGILREDFDFKELVKDLKEIKI